MNGRKSVRIGASHLHQAYVCLIWVFRPTRGFFTEMETSPLAVKRCEFWPMLSTHGYWAVRVLYIPHLLWHGPTDLYNGHIRRPMTLTPVAEAVMTTCFYDLVLSRAGSNPDLQHARRMLSLPLRHRGERFLVFWVFYLSRLHLRDDTRT